MFDAVDNRKDCEKHIFINGPQLYQNKNYEFGSQAAPDKINKIIVLRNDIRLNKEFCYS